VKVAGGVVRSAGGLKQHQPVRADGETKEGMKVSDVVEVLQIKALSNQGRLN
jgi:hypothetical protein